MNINLELAHTKKSKTNHAVYQAENKEILEDSLGHNLIYTDGTLSRSKAASAALLGDEAVSF